MYLQWFEDRTHGVGLLDERGGVLDDTVGVRVLDQSAAEVFLAEVHLFGVTHLRISKLM